MSPQVRAAARVALEVERVLGGAERVVLAVSGGLDSVVLMYAAVSWLEILLRKGTRQ